MEQSTATTSARRVHALVGHLPNYAPASHLVRHYFPSFFEFICFSFTNIQFYYF